MAPYHHHVSIHHRTKRADKVRKIAVILFGLIVVIAIIIAIDWFLNNSSTSNTVVTNETVTTVQTTSVSVYRSEYFQFQAPETWVLVASETTDNRFVYVKNVGGLLIQKFTVFIDRPLRNTEADFKLTHTVPITRSELGYFVKADDVSTHCEDSFPSDGNRDPRRIIHHEVSFICSPDAQQYNMVVGEIGEDEELDVVLSDGREVTMTLIYSDLTAYPGPGDVYTIINSFRSL